jgi:hypothetical protein
LAAHHRTVTEGQLSKHYRGRWLGDLLESPVSVLELAAGGLDAQVHHVLRRRDADLARENAFKVAHAHGDVTGEIFDRKSQLQVLGDPELKLLERTHLRSLGGEGDAELGLSSGAAQEEHELPSGFVRDGTAAIFFHPTECKIDASGDASGGTVHAWNRSSQGHRPDRPAEAPVAKRYPRVKVESTALLH